MVVDLNKLKDHHCDLLISLYFIGGWVKRNVQPNMQRALSKYIKVRYETDPADKQFRLYRLSPLGKHFVESLLRSYGKETGSQRGIAVERRSWEHISIPDFSKDEMVDAFVKISEMGNVPCDVYEDWCGGRKRVVVQDLDRAIAKISANIEWETHKTQGDKYLKTNNFSDCMAWLWIEYFDKLRKELRDIPFQQEFIIWNDS